jgi:tetratricopeptide (TPR) repeat protein
MNIKFSTFMIPLAFIITISTFLSLQTPAAYGRKSNKVITLKSLYYTKGDRAKATKLNKLGLSMYKKKNYQKAEEYWIKAAKADPSWWKPFFNMGCTAALKGNINESALFVELAIKRDPQKATSSLKADSDLKALRKTARYKALIANNQPGCMPKLKRISGGYQANDWGVRIYSEGNTLHLDQYGPGEVGGDSHRILSCSISGGTFTLKMRDLETVIIKVINKGTIKVSGEGGWAGDQCNCSGIFKK